MLVRWVVHQVVGRVALVRHGPAVAVQIIYRFVRHRRRDVHVQLLQLADLLAMIAAVVRRLIGRLALRTVCDMVVAVRRRQFGVVEAGQRLNGVLHLGQDRLDFRFVLIVELRSVRAETC